MTYQEFRKTYKWMLKKYPGTDRVYCNDMNSRIGVLQKIDYEKRGGKWKETARESETLTAAIYANCVDAIPFFRGLGGYERVDVGYTYVGYLPFQIDSISPDRTRKTTRKFIFDK